MKNIAILLILSILTINLHAQEKPHWKENMEFTGYIKELQSVVFVNDPIDFISGNIIHNRMNFRYYAGTKWTIGAGLRNRLYFGENIRYNPLILEAAKTEQGILNLASVIFEDDAAFMHSGFDRLWIEYAGNKFSVKIGRQRINWGINLAWNPNDIFNNYDITDFDYEERPGVDAINLNYILDSGGEIEFAINFDTIFDNMNFATMYKFNKKNYDFQILAGKFRKDITLGIGWAGNIKNAGFKGEVNSFYSEEDDFDFSISIGVDYSTKNGYFYFGQLYNSAGSNENIDLFSLFSGQNALSPKLLMPTQHSSLIQMSYQISPPWTMGAVAILGYGSNLGFLSPSITYSIANNWDILILSQHFTLLKKDNKIKSNSINMRLKWSF